MSTSTQQRADHVDPAKHIDRSRGEGAAGA
jgi:hypothetical protein